MSNDYSAQLANKYFASVARAQSLSKQYTAMSRSARASCKGSKGQQAKGSLCAGFDALESDELAIAASPQAFSWIDPDTTGAAAGVLTQSNPFAPVGDQGDCWTCVSFSVTATAEASVVRVLGLPGGSVRMSVQDLGFCPERKDELRFCQTSWDLLSALAKLQQRTPVAESCLKYTVADAKSSSNADSNCNYQCQDLDPSSAKGRFVPRQVRSLAAAQRHIRVFGGVITRINIYQDFRTFFASNPKGVYQGEQCEGADGSKLEAEHAAVLVGYNNTGQYWVARNSWGPKFGDQGYFRIKYGTCGVGSLGDMYGIVFNPDQPRKIPINVTPDVDNPGCYIYRARPGDSLGSLADIWGIDVRELLFNNSNTIDTLDEPLAGQLLTMCGLSSDGIDLKTPAWRQGDMLSAGLPDKPVQAPTITPTRTPSPPPPLPVRSAQQPVAQQPVAQQPVAQQPVAQQPVMQPQQGTPSIGIGPWSFGRPVPPPTGSTNAPAISLPSFGFGTGGEGAGRQPVVANGAPPVGLIPGFSGTSPLSLLTGRRLLQPDQQQH